MKKSDRKHEINKNYQVFQKALKLQLLNQYSKKFREVCPRTPQRGFCSEIVSNQLDLLLALSASSIDFVTVNLEGFSKLSVL